MDNRYPSNSDRSEQQTPNNATVNYQEHRVKESVVNGEAQRKEKSTFDYVREFFGIAECKSFRDYVSALSDMTNRVYGAIDTLLGNRRYQNTTVPGARVSYSSYYQGPSTQQNVPGNQTRPNPSAYGPGGIIFDMRADAEIVLAKMFELLSLYQNVSVGDMYDLAGLSSPNAYSDFKYGWRDLNSARVVPFGSKWTISLPDVIPLK